MADSSNGRVVEVINFLAAHPTESFTLSELAEHLSLSRGSAHRVLSTLTVARYLSRHPKHKTYSLGMALLAVGQAALEKHRSVDVARREMWRITREMSVQCVASVVVDDEMLIVAKEGFSTTGEGIARVGERRPFLPPLGLGHVAWAMPEAVESYLSKAPAELPIERRDYILKSLAAIRARGYSLAVLGPGLATLRQVVTDHVDNYRDDSYWSKMHVLIGQLSPGEIQLLSLDEKGAERISHISVPVFLPSGEVALEISMTGLPAELTNQDVESYAERLRSAAAIVTSETHGRMPKNE